MIVNWSRKSLESISSQICSGGTPLVSEKSFYGGDIPWLRTQEIQGAIVWDTEVKITKKGLENSAAKWVAKNSIALAMYGNTAGRVSTVGIDYTSNQACCNLTINPSLADYRFVYYSLLNDYQKLHDLSSGAAQRNLNAGLVRGYEILIPDSVLVQTKIADVLWNLDRKIALNRRKIATLEKMAKEIYDYWFVQYDFPDANGRPYKSSGGEMVYSPELKREIPKGWRVEQIGNHITSNRGISYSTKDIKTGKGVPMINLNSFNVDSSYKVKGIKTFEGEVPSSKRLSPFDLVMCNTQQTDLDPNKDIIGKTFLIPDIFSSPIVSSHHVTTIHVDDDDLKVYLNALFNTREFHAYISGYTSGTSIRGLNFSGVENYLIAMPPKRLLSKFAKIGLAGEKKKSLIIRDQEMVQNLRDFLLPLLMNGQARIGGAA